MAPDRRPSRRAGEDTGLLLQLPGCTMTAPDTIGVVIPTYERAKETVRAVESVLAQTLQAMQVVVVDDGSSAATIDELARLLASHPVTLVRAPRSTHPGRVRNAGLEVLRTQWVAFLDSDDTWAPHKLETQLSAVGGAVAICTNARRI